MGLANEKLKGHNWSMSQIGQVITALGNNGIPIQAPRPGERLGSRLNAGDNNVSTYTLPGTVREPRVIQVSTINRPSYLRIKGANDAAAFDVNDNAFLIPQNMFLYFTVLPGDEVQIRRVTGGTTGWQIFMCSHVDIPVIPRPTRTVEAPPPPMP